jgi:hypothetical protein
MGCSSSHEVATPSSARKPEEAPLKPEEPKPEEPKPEEPLKPQEPQLSSIALLPTDLRS